MGKKVFVVDLSICNGCYTCQFACKDEHCGNDWTPIAKPQPEIGQFWMKLTERVRGTVPKVKVAYRPHFCMHCDDAPCMEACPVEGAIYKREDGLVIIDPEKCTGCRNCMDACPYGVIYFNEGLNIAQKCTGCAHLLDDGWAEPRCVDACPTLALRLLDEDDAETQALIADAEVWKPELKDQVQRLQQQIISLDAKATASDVLQQRVNELESQLKNRPVPMAGAGGNDSELLQQLNLRDQKIQQLEAQLGEAQAGGGGGGTGFMGSHRHQMRIRELESQIDMIKKSEADMRKRYNDAMRRLAEKEEFNW